MNQEVQVFTLTDIAEIIEGCRQANPFSTVVIKIRNHQFMGVDTNISVRHKSTTDKKKVPTPNEQKTISEA